MDFNDIIKKSSVLMNMEKSGEITEKYGRKPQNGNRRTTTKKVQEPITVNEDYDYNIPTPSYNLTTLSSMDNGEIRISENTKLPIEIVESFKKTLAEEEAKNNELMSKLVSNTNIKPIKQKTDNKNNEILTENVNGGQENSSLKETIREVLREEISSMKIVSLRDKINLITNDGDVYEVVLKFKKNIKNKE